MSMSDLMREGELVEVKMTVRIPKAATVDDVEEWLRFEFRDNGSMRNANPLSSCEPEPWGSSRFEWEPLGEIGTRRESDHWEKPDGSRGCTVHYARTRL